MEFVVKNRLSFLLFDDGLFVGEAELIGSDWVFFPRSGLSGPVYAFGCCPSDSFENWIAGGGVLG